MVAGGGGKAYFLFNKRDFSVEYTDSVTDGLKLFQMETYVDVSGLCSHLVDNSTVVITTNDNNILNSLHGPELQLPPPFWLATLLTTAHLDVL